MDRKKVNVSVIMAVYNESKEYIQLAIESILTQSLQDFECIIVYDNPENQELWNWLHDYAAKDSRIVLIANEKNSGLAPSLNVGIELATGTYIARMDADDISLPDRLEKQYNFMQNNAQIDFIGTSATIIDSDGNQKRNLIIDSYKASKIKKYFFKETVLIHPSIMGKSSTYKKNQYDPSFYRSQDLELWLRIMNNCTFAVLEKPLVLYRVPNPGDAVSRIYKIQKSTYRGLQAFYKNKMKHAKNIYFWFSYLQRALLYCLSRLPTSRVTFLMRMKGNLAS